MNYPLLTESNSINYLSNRLHKCHENRVSIYYYVLNGGILLLFVLILGTVLYFCYKKKPLEYELRQKFLREQQYVLSKIKYHKDIHNQHKNEMSNITNLPFINV